MMPRQKDHPVPMNPLPKRQYSPFRDLQEIIGEEWEERISIKIKEESDDENSLWIFDRASCCRVVRLTPPFSIRCSRFIDGATFVTQELMTVFVIILRHSAVLLLSSDRGSVQRLESERECYEGGASTSDMPLSFNSGLLHQSFKTKHLNFVN